MTLTEEQAPANYVPAAAVIRKGQALFGIIGRKGRVGGFISPMCKTTAQLWERVGNCKTRVQEGKLEFLV